jgi:hypothetical protein
MYALTMILNNHLSNMGILFEMGFERTINPTMFVLLAKGIQLTFCERGIISLFVEGKIGYTTYRLPTFAAALDLLDKLS